MTIGPLYDSKSGKGKAPEKKESLSAKIKRITKENEKAFALNQEQNTINPLSLFIALKSSQFAKQNSGTSPNVKPGEYAAPPSNAQEMIKTTVERFEGGLSDHPLDRGGKTNKGITQAVYQDYRREKGLAAQDVAQMSEKEMNEIYYNKYMVPSGAAAMIDKDPKMAYALYDTSVLYGVGAAKKMYSASGGNLEAFLNLRQQRNYDIVSRNPSQAVFLNGWNNRVAALRKMLLNNETIA